MPAFALTFCHIARLEKKDFIGSDGSAEQDDGDPPDPRLRDQAAGGLEDDQAEHAGEEPGADGEQGLRHVATARAHRRPDQEDEQGVRPAARHGVHPQPLRSA